MRSTFFLCIFAFVLSPGSAKAKKKNPLDGAHVKICKKLRSQARSALKLGRSLERKYRSQLKRFRKQYPRRRRLKAKARRSFKRLQTKLHRAFAPWHRSYARFHRDAKRKFQRIKRRYYALPHALKLNEKKFLRFCGLKTRTRSYRLLGSTKALNVNEALVVGFGFVELVALPNARQRRMIFKVLR